jgi:hypothetical protein
LRRTAAISQIAALAGLSTCVGFGCKGSPLVADGRTNDAPAPPPSDGAATGGTNDAPSDGANDAEAGPDAPTVGCGMSPNQTLGTYVAHHVSIAGPDLDTNNRAKVRDRTYFVRLPMNYDPTVRYRVVYLGPGCGGNAAEDVLRLYTYSMNDAILVAIMPLPEFGACFDESVMSIEYPFFDAVHKSIESSFCVDATRQFYAGFSSGARLGYMLDCAFPDVLRASASLQGGLPKLPTCKKNAIALFILADTLETGNPYSEAVQAAQGVFDQNGCTGTFVSPMPPVGCGASCTSYDPMVMSFVAYEPNCVKYPGCPADDPIVFCSTQGQGQVSCEPWCDQAVWNFFEQF